MFRFPMMLLAGLLMLTGCSVDVARNDDGSLQVSTIISEESLADEIEHAIANPAIQDVAVDLQDGYALVMGTRTRLAGDGSDVMTFRVDLGVLDDRLDVVLSDVEIGDRPVSGELVENWNATLSNKLERAGRRNPDATLESVAIQETEVRFSWRVETPRSR